jgi:hypothetical protein
MLTVISYAFFDNINSSFYPLKDFNVLKKFIIHINNLLNNKNQINYIFQLSFSY